MTSVQSPISTPVVSPSPPFNVHLDIADMEFLSKKAQECKARQSKFEVQEGKVNPYIKIIAVLEQSQREGTGTALSEPLRMQLQADGEKRVIAGKRKVILPKSLGMPSPSASAGSRMIATLPATVPSTTSIDVAVCPALPTPSVQSSQALQAGRPEVLSVGLDAEEIDPFLEEVRSTSTLSVVTTSSTTAAATETTQSREPDREPSEETNPLEAKGTRRRGRLKKQRKPAGHSPHEKDQPTRRRDGSDSDGEGNGETR